MSAISTKSFNLPWHQHDHYWITLFPKVGTFSAEVKRSLQEAGMQAHGNAMSLQTGTAWKNAWDVLYQWVVQANMLGTAEAAVTLQPATDSDRKSVAAVQVIAENLWLGEALREDRLLCYLQPVVSTKDKIFGYESFARVKTKDGSVIGGDKIVAAARALNMEYMIDRHLHVQAIKTFVSSDFNGFLFINFFPGFIHRPAVYLDGLNETAKAYGIVAKNLVLDFTRAEGGHDLHHLKNVCEYARSCGYSIALDDIESLDGAKKLVPEIRPDFVKVDMQLVRQLADSRKRDTIHHIIEFVHANGSMAIAEGVETEEGYQQLKTLGADLFQGYYFSPPVPVEAALKRSTA